MARQLRLTDGEAVLAVDVEDLRPAGIAAMIHAIDPVGLTRADVRTLIAFLGSLDV